MQLLSIVSTIPQFSLRIKENYCALYENTGNKFSIPEGG